MLFKRSKNILFEILCKPTIYYASKNYSPRRGYCTLEPPYVELKSREALLTRVQPAVPKLKGKITIVGAGEVGIACAITILAQGITDSMCLIDISNEKAMGEMLDIQHGSSLLGNLKLTAGSDYSLSAGSRICIITAGVPGRGKSRLSVLQKNAELLKLIIPQVMKYSPDTLLLLVTNPVDVITYIAWKLSGLPKHKVLGTGTSIDTSRLHFLMSQKLDVPLNECHGYIIGEHGDSSFTIWSSVNIAGVRIRELNPKAALPDDPENWAAVHKEVVQCAYRVIKYKGHTCWAIACCCASISRSILDNVRNVQCVSLDAKGHHGIAEDIFLSLPAIVGSEGISEIIKLPLTELERAALHKSSKILAKAQSEVVL